MDDFEPRDGYLLRVDLSWDANNRQLMKANGVRSGGLQLGTEADGAGLEQAWSKLPHCTSLAQRGPPTLSGPN